MILRDYQLELVNAAWSSVRNRKNPVLVSPTGSGKSWVIAELCRQAVELWGGRAMVVAHRKELLEQNAEKIQVLLPDIKIGVYSAGLKMRDRECEIVVGGIQSIYAKAEEFGRRQLCIVDECHRIGPDSQSQYQQFIDVLGSCNPDLHVIGLSATPFRTGEGEITDGGVFHEIAHEVAIEPLIEHGFLCPLVNKPADNAVDMSRVQVRRGDFVQKQMEDAFLAGDNVVNVCRETVERCQGRESIIVFCSGITHADAVADTLEKMTDDSIGLVHSQSLPVERGSTIRRFRSGQLRWLVNVNVLTEGFDATHIDCVVMMRATVSPGLFAQAVGRGFRVDDRKTDCLVLDFGGNIDRHGPLNDPEFGRKRKSNQNADAPMKACGSCGHENYAGCAFCEKCGEAFTFESQELDETPDEQGQLLAQPEWLLVDQVYCNLHRKRTDPDSRTLRVDYYITNTITVSEWVCIEHSGFAREKAYRWWQDHSLCQIPETIEDAVDLFDRGALRMPRRILAKREGRFWRVLDREFDCERPEEWSEAQQDVFAEDEIPF